MEEFNSSLKTALVTLALMWSALPGSTTLVTAQTPAPPDADRIQIRTYDFKEAGKKVEYALFVPTSYDAAKPSPMVVLLHGLGSNPPQVIRYQGIVEEAEKHGYIVVAPYGYNERGWYGSRGPGIPRRFRRKRDEPSADPENLGELSEKDVFNVLALIRNEFIVDSDRIYLMGHSMGGGGTFYLGMKRPDLWAGLAPMSPAVYGNPDELKAVQHLQFIVIHGDSDRLVPVAIARRWVEKMKELGMTHEYIEIKDGNHVTSISRNPEMIGRIFAFFNAHQRQDAIELEPAGTGVGK